MFSVSDRVGRTDVELDTLASRLGSDTINIEVLGMALPLAPYLNNSLSETISMCCTVALVPEILLLIGTSIGGRCFQVQVQGHPLPREAGLCP